MKRPLFLTGAITAVITCSVMAFFELITIIILPSLYEEVPAIVNFVFYMK